jgi:uncharacterized protein
MSLKILHEKQPQDKQKVMFPQELEVLYILPAIRRQLTEAMLNKGLKQKQVATILNITEAAVSQYKKEKRAKLQFNEQTKQDIANAASRITKNPQLLFEEITKINTSLKQSGIFCQLHKERSWTPANCESICEVTQ